MKYLPYRLFAIQLDFFVIYILFYFIWKILKRNLSEVVLFFLSFTGFYESGISVYFFIIYFFILPLIFAIHIYLMNATPGQYIFRISMHPDNDPIQKLTLFQSLFYSYSLFLSPLLFFTPQLYSLAHKNGRSAFELLCHIKLKMRQNKPHIARPKLFIILAIPLLIFSFFTFRRLADLFYYKKSLIFANSLGEVVQMSEQIEINRKMKEEFQKNNPCTTIEGCLTYIEQQINSKNYNFENDSLFTEKSAAMWSLIPIDIKKQILPDKIIIEKFRKTDPYHVTVLFKSIDGTTTSEGLLFLEKNEEFWHLDIVRSIEKFISDQQKKKSNK